MLVRSDNTTTVAGINNRSSGVPASLSEGVRFSQALFWGFGGVVDTTTTWRV